MARNNADATTHMPFTALSREECRLVTCPTCGAEQAQGCYYPNKTDPSVYRRGSRVHRARIDKARQYRQEHRI